MGAALEHVGLQPCLVFAASVGAFSIDIASGVGGVDHPAQLAPFAVCGGSEDRFVDKAETPIVARQSG